MDATQANEKEQIQIKHLNKEAFEELILSIDTITATRKFSFCIIKGCKTKDYPNGNALKSWKRLCDKYIDKNAPISINIKRNLQG